MPLVNEQSSLTIGLHSNITLCFVGEGPPNVII